jgi:hypothetical protein
MCEKLDGKTWHLGPGNLYCPTHYWDDHTSQAIPPSQETKAAYSDLVRILKSRLKYRKIIRKMWIGIDGLDLLQQHRAWILARGNWINNAGEIVKSNIP